ncbi:hypothetical protein PG988_006851 [Apiospora saccharicola]
MSPEGERQAGHLKQGQVRPSLFASLGLGWVVQTSPSSPPQIIREEGGEFSCGWPVSASFSGCMTLQVEICVADSDWPLPEGHWSQRSHGLGWPAYDDEPKQKHGSVA